MTKSFKLMLLTLLTSCAATEPAVQQAPALTSDLQKSSYAQGVNYMKNLRQSQIPLDQKLFVDGLNDVLNDRPIQLSPEQLQTGQDWVFVQQVLYNQKIAQQNLAKGTAFLEANKKQPGVQTLASGLQYKIQVAGHGTRKTTLNDTATVRYRINRLNGEVLTVTEQPFEIQLDHVIKGLQEALLLMTEGAQWQLTIPADLAYGETGGSAGKVQPNETLIYEVALLTTNPKQPSAKPVSTTTPLIKPSSSWAGGTEVTRK